MPADGGRLVDRIGTPEELWAELRAGLEAHAQEVEREILAKKLGVTPDQVESELRRLALSKEDLFRLIYGGS